MSGAAVHQIRPAIPDLGEIVSRLGGELSAGGRQASVPGPGHSKRDRSLSLKVSDDGARVVFFSHAGDEFRLCKAHLGLTDAREYKPSRSEIAEATRRRQAEARKLEEEKITFCAEVWGSTVDLTGTPGALYLWNRGLVLDCPDIRFHPSAPRKGPWSIMQGDPQPPAPAPAIVCLARNGQGEPRGLHATYVTAEGRKAFGNSSRLMFGPMVGAAVRTAPVAPDGTLAVAEGLETAGSFSVLRAVPTWPAFSTSGLKNFEVPAGVRRLLVAADNDENGKGLEAAEVLAERARSRCEVEIHMPDQLGDWNMVLMGEAR
jgi:phage/plasmid primase-like uncharacterized protein